MTLKKYLSFALIIVFILSVPIGFAEGLANKTWASYPFYSSPSNAISDASGNGNHLTSQNCIAHRGADGSRTKNGKYSSSRILHESYVYNSSALVNNSNAIGGAKYVLPSSLTACLGIDKQIQDIVANLPRENPLAIDDFGFAFEGWIYPDEHQLNITSAGQNIMYAKDSFRLYVIEDNVLLSFRFHQNNVGHSTETFNLGPILEYDKWQHLAVSVEFIDGPGYLSNSIMIKGYVNGKAVPPVSRNLGGLETIANRGTNGAKYCAWRDQNNANVVWYESRIEWRTDCYDKTSGYGGRRYDTNVLPPVSFFSPDTAAREDSAQAWSGNFSHFSVFNESISAQEVQQLYFFGEGCYYPYNCTFEFQAGFNFDPGDDIVAFLNDKSQRTVVLTGTESENVSVNLSINGFANINIVIPANETLKLDLLPYSINFLDNTRNNISFTHGSFIISTYFESTQVLVTNPLVVSWTFGNGDLVPISDVDIKYTNPYSFPVSILITALNGTHNVNFSAAQTILDNLQNHVEYNELNTITLITNVKNYTNAFIPLEALNPILDIPANFEIDRVNFNFKNRIKGSIPSSYKCKIEIYNDNAIAPVANSSLTDTIYNDDCLAGSFPYTFNRGGLKQIKLIVYNDDLIGQGQEVIADMLVNLRFAFTFYRGTEKLTDYRLRKDQGAFNNINASNGEYSNKQYDEGYGVHNYTFVKGNQEYNFSIDINEWTRGELRQFINANGTIKIEIRDLESKLILPIAEVILSVTNLNETDAKPLLFNFNDNVYFLPNTYPNGTYLQLRVTRVGSSGSNIYTVTDDNWQTVPIYLTDTSITEIRQFQVIDANGVGLFGVDTKFSKYDFGEKDYILVDTRKTNIDGIVTYQVIPKDAIYRLCAYYETPDMNFSKCEFYQFLPFIDDPTVKIIRFLSGINLSFDADRPIYSTQIRSKFNDSGNKVREISISFNFDANGVNVSDYCVAVGKTSGNSTNFTVFNGTVFSNMNFCSESKYTFYIKSNTDDSIGNYSFNADFYYIYDEGAVLYVDRKQIKFDSMTALAFKKLKQNAVFEVIFLLIVLFGFGFLFFDSKFSLNFSVPIYLFVLLGLLLIQGYFLSSFINLHIWTVLVLSSVAYYMGKQGEI